MNTTNIAVKIDKPVLTVKYLKTFKKLNCSTSIEKIEKNIILS
tara:strand:+ start:252 stop:380 length:129 start_codon:yes stop_codon:yes gene_type:complete